MIDANEVFKMKTLGGDPGKLVPPGLSQAMALLCDAYGFKGYILTFVTTHAMKDDPRTMVSLTTTAGATDPAVFPVVIKTADLIEKAFDEGIVQK